MDFFNSMFSLAELKKMYAEYEGKGFPVLPTGAGRCTTARFLENAVNG